ncbi:MAG: 5-formyltetrahydrofolate cyclo-ligase [Rhodospirillales bacterium]|nr:5-formyltetrahydrofolate cyclo-ligase [Rhodospirillales bacterium]
MDTDIAEARRAERSRLLLARQEPDSASHARWSRAITRQLTAYFTESRPSLLGFYWPHRREYDPMPVVAQIIAQGGRAALPVILGRGKPLEYRRWYSGIAMTVGRYSFDIPHPAEGPAIVPDVLLVPLLGFDQDGYRLGYGGGYFDRTLAAYPVRPKAIGVGFEIGRLETIHPQTHDIPMDMIVTELGISAVR